jgi:pimeloyl-ACP methyl ester carboxylesterase
VPKCLTKGVEVHYLVGGNEQKKDHPIVLIHGAAGSSRRWLKQLTDLTDCYGIALDLPGHGHSQGEPCDQVFLYREWVKEFMEAMGMESAVIAGHSMGGAIAMDLYHKYPHAVKGLLLISTAPYFKVNPARLEAFRQGEFKPEWERDLFSASASDELVAQFSVEREKDSPRARYVDFLACSRFQAAGLKDVQVPTSILCGREDVNTPPRYSEKLRDEIPGARLRLVEKAAHQIIFEQPEIVNEEIKKFMGGL